MPFRTHAVLLTFVLLAGALAAQKPASAPLHLTSAAFASGAPIPTRCSCDGKNLSPALTWQAPPTGTRSFALILRDPDAPGGTFLHWALYNLPASARKLTEGIPVSAQLADGSRQGTNDFDRTGYGGPCPPHGQNHRYIFTLYALDRLLTLPQAAHESDLLRAMQGHILATSELTGRFKH